MPFCRSAKREQPSYGRNLQWRLTANRLVVARDKDQWGWVERWRRITVGPEPQESPTRPATSGLGSAVGWLPEVTTLLSRVIHPKVN